MAKAAQPARGRTEAHDSDGVVLDGEVVDTTERALSALSVSSAATLDSSMVAILTKAELDQMVVTARANPRSIQLAMDATKEIATIDLQTATECGYVLPRGKDKETGKAKVVEGPSVRLAEIVACQWGNCQAASRVTEINRVEGWVEAEGVFIDFQTNYRVTARTRRSIRGKYGLFNDDMITMTSNAASAIAFRNAVFKGVPKPIWNRAYEDTRKIVRGDEKSLSARRVDLLYAFKDNLGIPADKVYAILGVAGEKDIGLDELVIAAGFYSALKNNEITVEDLIKEIAPSGKAKTLNDAFAGQTAKPAADKAPPAAEEQKQPAAGAKPEGGEVIIEGKAPAGVLHFLAESGGLDTHGMRLTFKDGGRHSTAKPTANIPTYTELADLPPAEGEQGPGEGSTTTQPSEPASDGKPTDTTAGSIDTSSSEAGSSTETTGSTEDLEFPEGEQVDEQTIAPGATTTAEEPGAGGDGDDEIEEPAEFTAFREKISAMESYLTVKAALKTLRGGEVYKAATADERLTIRLAARDVVEALRETGKDPVDPASDPEYYSLLWLDGAQPPEVDPVWARLVRSKAYQALPEATRDAIAEATEKARL